MDPGPHDDQLSTRETPQNDGYLRPLSYPWLWFPPEGLDLPSQPWVFAKTPRRTTGRRGLGSTWKPTTLNYRHRSSRQFGYVDLMQLLLSIRRLLVSPRLVFLGMPSTLMPLVGHVADQSTPSNSPSLRFGVSRVHTWPPHPHLSLKIFCESSPLFSVKWASIDRFETFGQMIDEEGERTTLSLSQLPCHIHELLRFIQSDQVH